LFRVARTHREAEAISSGKRWPWSWDPCGASACANGDGVYFRDRDGSLLELISYAVGIHSGSVDRFSIASWILFRLSRPRRLDLLRLLGEAIVLDHGSEPLRVVALAEVVQPGIVVYAFRHLQEDERFWARSLSLFSGPRKTKASSARSPAAYLRRCRRCWALPERAERLGLALDQASTSPSSSRPWDLAQGLQRLLGCVADRERHVDCVEHRLRVFLRVHGDHQHAAQLGR